MHYYFSVLLSKILFGLLRIMVNSDTLPCINKPNLFYQCGGVFISKTSLKTHIESEQVQCKEMNTGDKNYLKKSSNKVQYNKEVLSFENEEREKKKKLPVDSLKEKPSWVISYPAQQNVKMQGIGGNQRLMKIRGRNKPVLMTKGKKRYDYTSGKIYQNQSIYIEKRL